MRRWSVAVLAILGLLGACGDEPPDRIEVAEEFLDAVYSLDPDRLDAAMASLPEDDRRFLTFYQGFAAASDYEVTDGPSCQVSGPNIQCSVRARDRFVDAVGLQAHEFERYTLSTRDGEVRDLRFRLQGPPALSEPFDWVVENRADVMDGPCRGFFDGGPTPDDCARAFFDAFEERLAATSSG